MPEKDIMRLPKLKEKIVPLAITTTTAEIYIFAGGELPTEFLKKAGIQMNVKHGEAVLKHE